MKFSAKKVDLSKHKAQCFVLAAFTNKKLGEQSLALQKQLGIDLDALYERGDFTGKAGSCLQLPPTQSNASKLLLLGFGEKGKTTESEYRKSVLSAASALKNAKDKSITFLLDDVAVDKCSSEQKARMVAQAMVTSRYQFTECKGKQAKKEKPVKAVITYATGKSSQANKGLKTGAATGNGMNVARELGNLPGNICTPTYLASEAKKLSKKNKSLSTKVLSEKQMKELGMGSLLSVSAGSIEPAQLIVMEYKGAPKSEKPHVLVGKGITFDTGGISLKPGAAMDEMKFDMCGAASVFGTIHTLIELEPAINVVAIVAAAENMPGGKATKPGDIVTSMSGQTIEILNTDAEGRLVLCDALTYAERYKPQSVVDIATLTGACVIALGSPASGLFSNNDELAEKLLAAGKTTGDKAWQMPIWDDYQKQLDSNFADMANIGGREAGSITAACFLSRFTKKYPWAHLDIAATAWNSGGAKGATGRPVPLLTEYLLQKA